MSDREPREDRSRETRILWMLGASAAVICVIVLATVGTGVWMVSKHLEQVSAEREQREAEEARQAEERKVAEIAEMARRKAEERKAAEIAEMARQKAEDERLAKLREEERKRIPPPKLQPPLPPPPSFPGSSTKDPEPAGPPLAPFTEPPNPYKPGTQTKLRFLKSVELPAVVQPPKPKTPFPNLAPWSYTRLVHSPKHGLLFALTEKSIWTYDLKADKALPARTPRLMFSDMSLSPDQSVLFAAEYGGSLTGGTPIGQHQVHRFDLASRRWEARKAPKIAHHIEAVDAGRILLLEHDQWVDVTLNKWEEDGIGVREIARARSGRFGDIEYDPRTGRVFHGGEEVTLCRLAGNTLIADPGKHGRHPGYGPIVLSQDGSRVFFGKAQLAAADGKPLETMIEDIYAASRDIAFGRSAYYRATTGSKLGEFDFRLAEKPSYASASGIPYGLPVLCVSPAGMSVWVLDREANTARQFALEGEK